MATFAYLRISTKDQTTEQQLTHIKSAGYKIESKRPARPSIPSFSPVI